jgi:hypothetical protein
MDLPSSTVYEVLTDRGIDTIFHANTVVTSCHFLRSGALLSRGSAERLNLTQTAQSSDEIDKRHSIWFDVFVDSVDIHRRVKNANHYGPALFALDSMLIKAAYTGRIWVTKLNPTKWAGKTQKERWFQSGEDLKRHFTQGTFDHMVVFRHCGGALPFGRHLRQITLDDPKMNVEGVDLFSAGFGALCLAMSDARLEVPINKRRCKIGCQCKSRYRQFEERTLEMFLPKYTE